MSSDTVRAHLDASPARVHRALTDPAELTVWFAEHVDVAPTEGRYAFWGRFTPGLEPGRQRLVKVAPQRLAFSWRVADDEQPVEITWTAAGTGTDLVVRHTGASPDLASFWFLAVANLANHVEGRSLVPRHDHAARATDTAVVRTVIDAEPAVVFEALTSPQRLAGWMMATDAHIEPHVGGRYDIGWDHGPVKILELDPDRVLAYSWDYQGSETVVRWELTGSAGRTHLTVVHSGFDDPGLAEEYRGGWPGFLVSLKRLVELGPRHRPIEVTY